MKELGFAIKTYNTTFGLVGGTIRRTLWILFDINTFYLLYFFTFTDDFILDCALNSETKTPVYQTNLS